MTGSYDSRADTLQHSIRVGSLLSEFISEVLFRAFRHDFSKTQPPEVEVFDEFTPQLKDLRFGTPEYAACLTAMGPALAHHYEANRHHPEHFGNGVAGMDLVDLIEMLADWKAATERVKDGDLNRSLEINKNRFGLDPQLASILRNTAVNFGWIPGKNITYN